MELTNMTLKFHQGVEQFQKLLREHKLSNQSSPKREQNCYRFEAINGACIKLFDSGTVQVQGRNDVRGDLEPRLASILDAQTTDSSITSKSSKQIFVVHGHDNESKEQLELTLHKLGLPDHFILQNTSGNGLTIIEALEDKIGTSPASCFGIVLLTPDDIGYSIKDGESKAEPRARQNVVLEMGMLLSALGRENVVILKKGHLELPSDTNGILYLGFNNHVKETVPRLVERLHNSGFDISSQNVTKASA